MTNILLSNKLLLAVLFFANTKLSVVARIEHRNRSVQNDYHPRTIPQTSSKSFAPQVTFALSGRKPNRSPTLEKGVFFVSRGGSIQDAENGQEEEEDNEETESDSDSIEDVQENEDVESEDDYYDDEENEEEEDDVDTTLVASVKSKMKKGTKETIEYDEPYTMPMTIMIYSTFAPILISRKIDMYQPRVVRTLRYLFIATLILQQAFIFYIRIMAKIKNDRTVVHIKSPLDAAMDSKIADAAGGGGNEMLKKLASSFLAKDTTIMEYDMSQATQMQTGIIFTMLIMWILHFKMEQIQPLLVTVISNTFRLFYNPLFQVYILGRNLERPFVTPKPEWLKQQEAAMEERKKAAAEAADEVVSEEDEDVEVEMTIEEVEEVDEDIEEDIAEDDKADDEEGEDYEEELEADDADES